MAVYSDGLSASFDRTVNVQSISATTKNLSGNFTAWGPVRAVLVREEEDVATVVTENGEEKQTTHLWTVLEIIYPTDRLWLTKDAQADPVANAPNIKKARKAAKVYAVTGPGAHWEVRI